MRTEPGGLSKTRLRAGVGMVLVLGHTLLFCLVLALYPLGGFNLDQTITTAGLIGPLLAASATAVLRWYLKGPGRGGSRARRGDDAPAGRLYSLFVLGLPLLFITLLVLLTLAQAFHWGLEGFRSYTALVGAVETGFAIQLGLLVEALFSTNEDRTHAH